MIRKLTPVIIMRIAENAAAGPIFRVLINRYIPTGIVAKFARAKKVVAPNSPTDTAKLNNPATIIPDNSRGISIFTKVLNREDPRLRATLITVGSRFDLVAVIMR